MLLLGFILYNTPLMYPGIKNGTLLKLKLKLIADHKEIIIILIKFRNLNSSFILLCLLIRKSVLYDSSVLTRWTIGSSFVFSWKTVTKYISFSQKEALKFGLTQFFSFVYVINH